MSDQYVVVYTPTDEAAPKNLRTHTLDAAKALAARLNERSGNDSAGHWSVHRLGPAES